MPDNECPPCGEEAARAQKLWDARAAAPAADEIRGEGLGQHGALARHTSRSDAECDDNFGLGLVRRWRAAAEPWCVPGASAGALPSTVTCRPLQQANHEGVDTLCDITNLRLDRRKVKVARGGEKIADVRGRRWV
jgi:hypothetical protein